MWDRSAVSLTINHSHLNFDQEACLEIMVEIIIANRNPLFLRFAESLAINKFRPWLREQKDLVFRLKLPHGNKDSVQIKSTIEDVQCQRVMYILHTGYTLMCVVVP